MESTPPDPIIPFGQHKGKYASQVDVRYLDWLIGQSWLREPLKGEIELHLDGRADWQNLDVGE